MIIKYWTTFSKRKNSTKRPSGGTEINVSLKENTSVESPVFVLKNENAFEMVYIQAFNHFYFVSDVVNVDNYMSEIHCKQDVLATYKNEIRSSTVFVEYAAHAYDPYITDSRIHSKTGSTLSHHSMTPTIFNNTGCYIFSVISGQSGGTHAGGFATYYVLTPAQFQALAVEFCVTWDTTIWEELGKKFGNARDSMISCIWVPFSYSFITTYRARATLGDGGIVIGGYGTGIDAYLINDTTPIAETVGLASIWIGTTVERFKRVEPYTHMRAYLPYYGCIDVPTLPVTEADAVNFMLSADFLTGDVTVKVFAESSSEELLTINYNCAVQCPISSNETQQASLLTALGGIAATALTDGATAIAGAGAMATSMANSLRSVSSVRGSQTGRSYSSFGSNIDFVIETLNTTKSADMANTLGQPYFAESNLLGLSGYVKCREASVSISGRDSDRDEINSFLNSGIFLE